MVAAVLDLDEGARMPVHAGDEMARRLAHSGDVGDIRLVFQWVGEIVGAAEQLLGIAEHAVDLGHGGKRRRVDLCRAAGDHDPRIGPLPPGAADRLPCLAHGFRRYSAAIDQHGILETSLAGALAHNLGFEGVQAATECEDVERLARCGHGSLMAESRRKGQPQAGTARRSATVIASSSPSAIVPDHSYSAGPVIRMWS